MTPGQHVFCLRQHRRRQAQFFGNDQGIALPGDALEQAVRWGQRLLVEFHGRILHSLLHLGKELQLVYMGCGHGKTSLSLQRSQESHGQGGALRGICTRTQFIEKSQRCRALPLQDGDDIPEVARKGAQRLLDALLVADVGADGLQNGKYAFSPGRDVQPALRHRRKQPYCLQGDRFPARVGTGNDKDAALLVHGYRQRHRRFAKKGMARPLQVELRFASQQQLRRCCILLQAEAAPGHNQVQPPVQGAVAAQRTGGFRHPAAEQPEDALDLPGNVALHAGKFILQLHHRHGLDEQGGPAGRLIMHHPADQPAVLLFHRQDKAVAAEGDQRLLKQPPLRRIAQIGIHFLPDIILKPALTTAQGCQFGGGAIQNSPVVVNRTNQFAPQGLAPVQQEGQPGQEGIDFRILALPEKAETALHPFQKAAHSGQLASLQCAALFGPGHLG